ncbi:ABC transporter ATP-binding protein [Pseudooceanicola sediminis]|uniref:ABC transporter ATP-binding protein n=1 Tax=Pseudooceanicola sediminis TaxID=2211117 RepID=A0A399J2H9_9RHOB|nr:ABC transporter ATP-binding protein [Pseudooceanicola sediminis]KAA2312083.1 ABC transporter ATP-binding protein [Puniceibacterium sp. HSS470]RII38092.1 ABC transporter ATP-binding protein [Pseudooceanicola sediminis]|tara:strand:+ start:38683 stop:39456 length:774 start_codon:yes stop_codon:yes gene_type:complete
MNTPILSAAGIGMTFESASGPVEAIGNVSFDLREGEILALVGPSGCGKTTLFNIITGLLAPSRGGITIASDRAGQDVGYMLQKDLLLPWRSVIDNVILGLEVRGMARDKARAIARDLIEAYGLKGFEDARPGTLSGGMRQRVAIMRTLAFDPAVVLLDEPFSALDFQTRTLLQQDVARIISERRKSAILITHDIGEAITMADRILVLSNRPSTVIRTMDIQIPRDARDPVALRSDQRYNDYFVSIWQDLQLPVVGAA